MEQRETYEDILLSYMDRLAACVAVSMPEKEREQRAGFLASYPAKELHDRNAFLSKARNDYEAGLLCLVESGEFLPLLFLADTFGLNRFEEHVLCLLYALELKPFYLEILGEGVGTPLLAKGMFPGEIGLRELLYEFREDGVLAKYFLEKESGSRQRVRTVLRLSDRVLSFLTGQMLPAKSQLPFGSFFSGTEPVEAWEGGRRWIDFLKKQFTGQEEGGVVCLYGNEGSGRRLSVKTALKESEKGGLFIDLPLLYEFCTKEDNFYDAMNALSFELLLLRMVPVILDISKGEAPEMEATVEKEFLERVLSFLYEVCPVLVVCADRKESLSFEGPVYYLPEEKMKLSESLSYWERLETEGNFSKDFCCDWMAGKFTLTRGQITRAVKQAERQAFVSGKKSSGLTMEEVTRECYEVIHHKMGKKAKRVEPRYRMEDLILPKRQKEKLFRAVEQVRYRRKVYEEWGFQNTMSYGKGISMAFVGAPGTGKTMAAQVIAAELSMELYKVELSGIVSKYIGETEKNLEEIFEQARKSQVILFFDEADALFSKRSEGKDTNDKYSNMEASFLLQKMEAYDGITILATNLFHHFDEAYKRRLKLVVDFPVPQEEDRKRLWHSMLPAELPCGEIDFDFLASSYELTGSNIRNILLYAAFLAAAKGKPMDMEEIIPAIANEYGKNGKVFTKEDASEYFLYL